MLCDLCALEDAPSDAFISVAVCGWCGLDLPTRDDSPAYGRWRGMLPSQGTVVRSDLSRLDVEELAARPGGVDRILRGLR
jgi:hypothetical protein